MRARRVGRYLLTERLAVGGQAEVFLARVEAGPLARVVALKRPLKAQGDAGRRRLLEEARLASRVAHPNVLAALDHGVEEDGTPWLVLEWVDGVPLGVALAARTLPAPLAGYVGLSVARALAAIHAAGDDAGELGIVHRDVTPWNVLLGTHGEVKLGDFGIAKARRRLVRTTEPGRGRGTPGFAAPEQLRGEPCDARTDAFGLGRLLEAMAARSDGAEPLAALGRILSVDDRDARPGDFDAIAADLARVCPPPADAAGELGAWVRSAFPREGRRRRTLAEGARAFPVTPRGARTKLAGAAALAATAALLPPLLLTRLRPATAPVVASLSALPPPRDTTLAPALAEPPRADTRLVLRSVPAGAEAFVDESPVGATPLALNASPGAHRVRFVNAILKVERELAITVPRGKTKVVEVDLLDE